MQKVIGIDLGTTNSVVAFKTRNVEILRNKEGEELTRSCVGIRESEILVGRSAFQLLGKDPQNTILSVKRLMGVAYSDKMVQKMIAETGQTRGYYKYTITQLKGGTDDAVAVVLGGKQYVPEQISAEILKKLKADAEERLNDTVTHAVITVPAYFTDKQKNATKLAAKYAGIKVLKLLAEPTAAAIAYGVDNLKAGEAKTVLIYDFGGGTFDLSILNIVDGQYLEMGTGGDRWLGGDDIDKELSNYIYRKVCDTYGIDINIIDDLIENLPKKKKFRFLSDFRKGAEQLKIELSFSQRADFILEDILEDENGDTIDINITVTRQEFEQLVRPYVQRSIDLVDALLKEMHYDIEMIDDILLVGGTSCIPLVKKMLIEKYGSEKVKASKKPMLTVAEGAAILAHRLDDNYEPEPDDIEGIIDEVTYSASHNLYIMVKDANGNTIPEQIVEKQTPLPLMSSRPFRTSADNQKIIKVEIKADVENKQLENTSISFLSLDQDLPAGSALIFDFELDTDEILHATVYPQGQRNKAKQIFVTRDQKDAKAFQVIDEEIQRFNAEDLGIEKQQRFEKIIIEKLKDAERIGVNEPLHLQWDKIRYEVKEAADLIQSEQTQQQRDNSILAKILISNYSMLISDRDLNAMKKLIVIIENEDDEFKVSQAQKRLEDLTDEYPVLLHTFFIKIAAQRAASINAADAQKLNKMHDTIVFHFQNDNPDEAFETLNKATELAEQYLNIKDMGKIITDIKK